MTTKVFYTFDTDWLSMLMVKEFHGACRTVLRSAKDRYALAYANAGLGLVTEDEISCQCLYILNNLGGWRGEEARATKEIFHRLSKGRRS
jgi:hypothetical protein